MFRMLSLSHTRFCWDRRKLLWGCAHRFRPSYAASSCFNTSELCAQGSWRRSPSLPGCEHATSCCRASLAFSQEMTCSLKKVMATMETYLIERRRFTRRKEMSPLVPGPLSPPLIPSAQRLESGRSESAHQIDAQGALRSSGSPIQIPADKSPR